MKLVIILLLCIVSSLQTHPYRCKIFMDLVAQPAAFTLGYLYVVSKTSQFVKMQKKTTSIKSPQLSKNS